MSTLYIMRWVLFFLCLANIYAIDSVGYVWSLGFAMDCDITPFRSLPGDYRTCPPRAYLNPSSYVGKVKQGSIVWVQEYKLKEFFYAVLPTIKRRFVLVIGDGDRSFPTACYGEFPVHELLSDPRILHIFAQNRSRVHPKLSSIPIGMDFHSVATNPAGYFGEPHTSVEEQQRALEELLATFAPTHLRKKRALVDFHLSNYGELFGESRAEIFAQICPSGVIDALQQKLPRSQLWARKGEYAFSISPHGNGLDCHRTWEDLVLGCIVIVKSSILDSLYEGLPVVIVKDWGEVNEANFAKWLELYGDAFTNPSYREKLTRAYWMAKIRRIAAGCS